MRASLLFYRKLRKELEDYGFEINPYDPCVANKMTTSERGQPWSTEMVCGRVPQRALGLQRSWGCNVHNGERSHLKLFAKSET